MNDQIPHPPILDRVRYPSDLRRLSDAELAQLPPTNCAPRRSAPFPVTGGHLGSSLGVVELTVAIHAVFNTPYDKLVWDVGHQCYPPTRSSTGRRDRNPHLAPEGRPERVHQAFRKRFTTRSARRIPRPRSPPRWALRWRATWARPRATPSRSSATGRFSAGMAYEALNNAGDLGRRLFVILNDNEMRHRAARGGDVALISRGSTRARRCIR